MIAAGLLFLLLFLVHASTLMYYMITLVRLLFLLLRLAPAKTLVYCTRPQPCKAL